MQLSNGTNSIDEGRYRIISDAMQHRRCEDNDFLSNMIAQGRSEYSMDDLIRKQDAERTELEERRRTLSIAQWVKLYPVSLYWEITMPPADLEEIPDDETAIRYIQEHAMVKGIFIGAIVTAIVCWLLS